MTNEMFDILAKAMEIVPKYLNDPKKWDSLVINRREPHTYRAFMYPEEIPGHRICLHRFDACGEDAAFLHPHPWPSAMNIFEGKYRMRIGASVDLSKETKPIIVLDEVLSAGSIYSMTNPLGWHSVQPLTTCWSLMVNGLPWGPDVAHGAAPTTKGKDLDKMADEMLDIHLNYFKRLFSDWSEKVPKTVEERLAAIERRLG